MKEWLVAITEPTIVAIDILAFFIIVIGTVETLFRAVRLVRPHDAHEHRLVWLRYARWLVAALTFQLAADIVESATSTAWEDIARLGAITAIRTFLNYFLERDLAEMRARQKESTAASPETARSNP